MQTIYLILILSMIIFGLIILQKFKSRRDGYPSYGSQPEGYQPFYPGDDVMMYSLFPYLSILELARFGNSNKYNYNLVKRFFNRNSIPFSLRDLNNFIFLKGQDLDVLLDIMKIFNAIEPQSAFIFPLKGEEYLLLDKKTLPYKIRKADGSMMNITQPFQIFINILDETETEGEKNILGGITFAERTGLNFLIDIVRDIPTEKDFNIISGTNRDIEGRLYNLYMMNIDYPYTYDEDRLEEEMEVDEVLDISTALQEGKIINVYTGEDILSQIFKERKIEEVEIE